jgi:hypothetical protein
LNDQVVRFGAKWVYDENLKPNEITLWDETQIGELENGNADAMQLPQTCNEHNKRYQYYLVVNTILGICEGGITKTNIKSKEETTGVKFSTCRISFKWTGPRQYGYSSVCIEKESKDRRTQSNQDKRQESKDRINSNSPTEKPVQMRLSDL